MTLLKVNDEWAHRRYRPFTKRYRQSVRYGVEVDGDPNAPPKGLWTGWREKWSWALVSVKCRSIQEPLLYYPGYSYDGGYTFRRTIVPVTTPYFAFQIGPKPVMFAVFGKHGEWLDVDCELRGNRLELSTGLGCLHSTREVTFV